MQGNVFQFAFDTYNSTISTHVSEKNEKIDPDGYDNEGVFFGCDVYKKLKWNLQKEVNSLMVQWNQKTQTLKSGGISS